jgi:metallo-beta-lactamase family protein
VRSPAESIAIQGFGVPSIIVSAFGTATGDRVVHHLRALWPDPRNTVMIVGFAARCTRARDPVEGARTLKMFGMHVPVLRCRWTSSGCSRADADEILDWLRDAPAPNATWLAHGEPEGTRAPRDADRVPAPGTRPAAGRTDP